MMCWSRRDVLEGASGVRAVFNLLVQTPVVIRLISYGRVPVVFKTLAIWSTLNTR